MAGTTETETGHGYTGQDRIATDTPFESGAGIFFPFYFGNTPKIS